MQNEDANIEPVTPLLKTKEQIDALMANSFFVPFPDYLVKAIEEKLPKHPLALSPNTENPAH